MKIGLFFGSFNPIHIGHLIIANYMVENYDIDQTWLVVSPQNPLKNRKNLLGEYERLEMVNLAIEGNLKLKATDIEFYMPKPSFTIDTMVRLQEKYPEHEWYLIMGTDTVNTLPKWKNYEVLIDKYKVLSYPRPGAEITFKFDNLIESDTPMMDISASYIRRTIKNNRSAKYLLQDNVLEFIEKWGYYK